MALAIRKIFCVSTLALLSVLSGCVAPHPPMTRAEYLDTVTRTYADTTPDQVLTATEKLMRLADGNDFQISHSADGLRAARNWLIYAVIAMANGTDYWDVKATPSPAGTVVQVQVSTQGSATGVIATGQGNYAPLTTVGGGNPVPGNAIYDVFFARLDFLLGRREDWMTCDVANDRVEKKIVWGDNSALCNTANMMDAAPEGVIVPERRKRRPAYGAPPF